jgi:hypothetical protein
MKWNKIEWNGERVEDIGKSMLEMFLYNFCYFGSKTIVSSANNVIPIFTVAEGFEGLEPSFHFIRSHGTFISSSVGR